MKKCDLKNTACFETTAFRLIVIFSLNCITTRFVTDWLCLDVIYDPIVGWHYGSKATTLEVQVPSEFFIRTLVHHSARTRAAGQNYSE